MTALCGNGEVACVRVQDPEAWLCALRTEPEARERPLDGRDLEPADRGDGSAVPPRRPEPRRISGQVARLLLPEHETCDVRGPVSQRPHVHVEDREGGPRIDRGHLVDGGCHRVPDGDRDPGTVPGAGAELAQIVLLPAARGHTGHHAAPFDALQPGRREPR